MLKAIDVVLKKFDEYEQKPRKKEEAIKNMGEDITN